MQERLANEKISKLLLSLSIPSIFAQLVSLIYNMVDRMYIGRMPNGTLAMAAIGLCVSLVNIIGAFNGLFGRGGAPLSAIKMGEKDLDHADHILSNSFTCLLCSSIIITIVVSLFKEPILYFFGASSDTIEYAKDYVSIYVLGTVFMQLTVGLNYFINTQGFNKFGLCTTLFGAGLNIILDPILIFYFNMGIKGAALATVLSQGVSCIWVLSFFLGKRTILHIHLKYMKLKWSIIKEILKLGAAPFFMWISEGFLTIAFNQQLLRFGGSLAVSGMTMLISMYDFILLPIEGVAAGSQPILSFNYGAKNYQRVKETLSLAIKVTLTISVICTVLMELFPSLFLGIFTTDTKLLALGCKMLRIYIFGAIVMGANSTFQQTYTSLGDGTKSFFFAFLRKIILLIPLIYILPMLPLENKVMLVVLAEPIADLITTSSNSLFFKFKFLKTMEA